MYEIAASDAPKWVVAVREMTGLIWEMGPNPLKRGRPPQSELPEQAESMV